MPPLPEQFLNSLSHLAGLDLDAFSKIHEETERITSIRLNPSKKTTLDFELSDPIPWCETGYFLQERPQFTFDPCFQAGAYYVQEPGSMFLWHALKQHVDFSGKLRVLDLCAAPGGKSTLLSTLIHEDSLLVSNEIIRSRAELLAYQLSKWGHANSIVTNNEPARFAEIPGFFDLMVVDAPCSGSGMFRKQPESIEEWSPSAVTACSIRQKNILEAALPALKEDGILFYSTCSYSVEENEQVVGWLLKEQDMELLDITVDPAWNIVRTELGYRFYPHLMRTEGFFCAILRKRKVTENTRAGKKNRQQDPLVKQVPMIDPQGRPVKLINQQLHLMPEQVLDFQSRFGSIFYFRKAGIVIGEVKGKDLVPDHELALSTGILHQFETLEVGLEDALQFLRKKGPALLPARPGFTLLTYRGNGIGWVKILPNRVNNYLPNEYRILS